MSKQKTILIVEDESSISNLLKNKLERKGYEVFQAPNGEVGLLIALEKKPDLILLDLNMPVMDGMTMLNKLRENEWGKKASVIVLTNLANNEKVEKSIKLGAFDYLVKNNWSLDEMVKIIKIKLC